MTTLLANSSTYGFAQKYKADIAYVRSLGIPFYIGEGNSVSCGGMPGVSNVFGATLWAMDSLFSVASVGVGRWNFHGGPQDGGAYTAISYDNATTNLPRVRTDDGHAGLLHFLYPTGASSILWNAGFHHSHGESSPSMASRRDFLQSAPCGLDCDGQHCHVSSGCNVRCLPTIFLTRGGVTYRH
jgi:hypothetical protein